MTGFISFLTKNRLLQQAGCLLLLVLSLSCSNNNRPMEIKYTSVNDMYAHYVFNFEDDAAGIQQLYDYALNDLKASRHYRDSIKASGHVYDANENLPLKAEPVILYTPPTALQGEPDSHNMLLTCVPDENTYALRGINVAPCSKPTIQDADWTMPEHRDDACILQLKKKGLDLCTLDAILHKINALQYHTASPSFRYTIQDIDKKELLSIAYTGNGQYIEMIFPR